MPRSGEWHQPGDRRSSRCYHNEIISRKASFQFCNFIHDRRNFNYDTPNLTKFSCNLGIGRHIWLGNPHDPTSVLPPSGFINPLCILCQILTLNLTNKMLMQSEKTIYMETIFKHESNDIIFGDMH